MRLRRRRGEDEIVLTREELQSALLLVVLLAVLPQGWVSAWAWVNNLRWLYVLVVAYLVSRMAMPVVFSVCERYDILDHPDKRKVHAHPTPRLGGLAVYAAFMFALFRNFQYSQQLIGLVVGASIIFWMGALDDARGLPASWRLFGQIAASLVVVGFGTKVTFYPAAWPAEYLFEATFTVVWLVGITNAFNFLDGMDGMAAGLGISCALLMLGIAWPTRQGELAYAASALAGASLGFLPTNWHPAKMFLGDSGSTFIGFTLAGLAVIGGWASNNPLAAMSTPLLILSIPIFDMTYITISRVRRGAVRNVRQWIEYVGRDHFHHRLMNLGMKPPEAVRFVVVLNTVLGLAALVVRYTNSTVGAVLLLVQAFLIFVAIVTLMLLGREFS